MGVRADVAFAAVVLCLWPSLFFGLGVLAVYKRPKRALVALSAALATAISGVVWILVSGESLDRPTWSGVLVFAILTFLIVLLGTYIKPALEGTTYDEWIADAKRRVKRR